jgi:hypothetical protein
MKTTWFKNYLKSKLKYIILKRYKSKLNWREAPKYENFLRLCQKTNKNKLNLNTALNDTVKRFENDGFVALSFKKPEQLAEKILNGIREKEKKGINLWNKDRRYVDFTKDFEKELEQVFNSEIKEFLESVYKTYFRVYFGVCYRSQRQSKVETAGGSQLWHADGGPGTCINLMYYLTEATESNGAMECLPWCESLKIFKKEQPNESENTKKNKGSNAKEDTRDILCEWYSSEIEKKYKHSIVRPTGSKGMFLAFRNNILHKGGFPEIGCERIVCVFHIYPSIANRLHNIPEKFSPYPKDPNWKE